MQVEDTRPASSAPPAGGPDDPAPRIPARPARARATAAAVMLAVATLLAIGWVEATVEPAIPLAALYCIPVGLFTWLRGGRAGWLVVLAASAISARYALRLEALHGTVAMTALHALLDLALFATTHVLIDRLRSQVARLNIASDLYGRLAFRDRLTDLPNRHLLYDRVATAITTARRNSRKVALLFLDLDGCKPVNDRHGHQAGDRVLKAVAGRLVRAVRQADTVARIGGDEFAVLIGDVEDRDAAEAVARKILSAIAEPIDLGDGVSATLGASIGIGLFPDHGMEIDRLIAVADTAMYASKARGKNCCTFAEPGGDAVAEQPWFEFTAAHEVGVAEIDHQHRQLVRMANRLNDAIRAGEDAGHVAHLFEELVRYAGFHFASEERYMARHDYPAREEHELRHAYLLQEIAHVRERMQPGSELTALQTIKDWLLDHIDNADKDLGLFLSGRGVR